MTDAPAPVVRCDAVTREFVRGSGRTRWLGRRAVTPAVKALDGVSMACVSGELVGLQGPSGSGKSTLLHLLAALDTPTAGTIEVAGQDTRDLDGRERARLRLEHVGIVFQRFHLLPALSARGNVALPLIERGVGKRARRAHATELLERVGLAERIDHTPAELSGGEQQRVAIARALVNEPSILLADEPTGELDSETGGRIIDLLAEAASDRAVVIASHDPDVLAAADRVLRLHDGRLIGDD